MFFIYIHLCSSTSTRNILNVYLQVRLEWKIGQNQFKHKHQHISIQSYLCLSNLFPQGLFDFSSSRENLCASLKALTQGTAWSKTGIRRIEVFLCYSIQTLTTKHCFWYRAVSLFLQTIRLLRSCDNKNMWRAFIKSIDFMGILWTKTVNIALYYLPGGLAGGHILISLFHGLFKASGYEGGAWEKMLIFFASKATMKAENAVPDQ